MTPEERERADSLAASGFQLAADLAVLEVAGTRAQARQVQEELSRVCTELVPFLVQLEAERQQWRERRLPSGPDVAS